MTPICGATVDSKTRGTIACARPQNHVGPHFTKVLYCTVCGGTLASSYTETTHPGCDPDAQPEPEPEDQPA